MTRGGVTRLEERTPNTAACPDLEHRHEWRKRRPELTEGRDRFLSYVATVDGTVVISEEALSQLLRLAGFTPEETRW